MKSVSQIALKDISKYIRNNNLKNGEFGFVGQDLLQTKKTRFLNKLLGLRGINHIGNKNNVKK